MARRSWRFDHPDRHARPVVFRRHGCSGGYGRILPAATYDITASAYGYLPATVTGFRLPTDGATQHFVLQAAPPVAPQVSSSADGDLTRLTWTHVPPNMTYAAYRGEVPYFAPAPDYPLESWEMPFPDPIIYDDPDPRAPATGSMPWWAAMPPGRERLPVGWGSSISTCSPVSDRPSVTVSCNHSSQDRISLSGITRTG